MSTRLMGEFSASQNLGAAAVALAGIISSTRVTNTRLLDNKYLLFGAGAVRFLSLKFSWRNECAAEYPDMLTI